MPSVKVIDYVLMGGTIRVVEVEEEREEKERPSECGEKGGGYQGLLKRMGASLEKLKTLETRFQNGGDRTGL